MELGKQIREHRAALGLTQEELAEKIFVSRQTVSNWENDKSYPDIHSLLLLGDLFGVSLDQLVKGDIHNMKERIQKTEVRKFQRISVLFGVLLFAMIFTPIPLVNALGLWGAALWALLAAATLYLGFRVEKLKRERDIYTYREIVAYMDGETLDDLEREKRKRRYQRVGLAILAGAVGLLISLVAGFILRWMGR